MTLLIHVLSLIFGTSSWMSINGAWMELPLMVNELPEGWYLPSYIIIIIQFANVGPLFVSLMHKFKPGVLSEVPVIYVVVSTGTVACFLLAFLWRYTTHVAGELHSTAFFVLIFFLSLVDCTSSLTFLPFMARFHPRYVTSFFIGQGLSGLIPALVALAQGSGISSCVNVTTVNNNRTASNTAFGNGTDADIPFHVETRYSPTNFSTLVFFIILTTMMLACLVAFFFLNRLPKVWELSKQKLCASDITLCSVQKIPVDGKAPVGIGNFTNYPVDGKPDSSSKGADAADPDKVTFSRTKFVFIYSLLAWANVLYNGVLPSVQSYSCLPYSNMAFHLTVTLSASANPLACTIAMFLPSRSLPLLGVLSAIGTAFGAYIMGMAALSPCPVLHDSKWGEAIIVISWILFTGLFSYVQLMLGVILRSHSHSALVWYGAMQQLASMVGALVMFPLVSVYSLFKSADFCNFQCPA